LRSRFAEQDVFEREMPRLLRCRAIGRENLVTGRWSAPITALLAQDPPRSAIATNGARAAAAAILTAC
jgi:hypothetical protein